MNKIRTERQQVFEHDPRELGEDVASAHSDAFANFLLGVNREAKHWSWQNYVIDVANDLTADEAREVHELLHTLTEAFRIRTQRDSE